MENKNLVFITGLSGAGKSLVLDTFEDLNYYVLDNLAPQLVPEMARLLSKNTEYSGVAVVIDMRCGDLFKDFEDIFIEMKKTPICGFNPAVLVYLDCARTEIVRRFKETRRKHPLAKDISVSEAIIAEKAFLVEQRAVADMIIDTTKLEPEVLRKKIKNYFDPEEIFHKLNITVLSFGFKYGMPLDADLVFDVRFLNNPYWVPELKNLTGKDEPVKNFVLKDEKTKEFLKKLYDLIDFSVPEYFREGKAYLTIGIGCTGGRHRSVSIAERLAEYLSEKYYSVKINHREDFRI